MFVLEDVNSMGCWKECVLSFTCILTGCFSWISANQRFPLTLCGTEAVLDGVTGATGRTKYIYCDYGCLASLLTCMLELNMQAFCCPPYGQPNDQRGRQTRFLHGCASSC